MFPLSGSGSKSALHRFMRSWHFETCKTLFDNVYAFTNWDKMGGEFYEGVSEAARNIITNL